MKRRYKVILFFTFLITVLITLWLTWFFVERHQLNVALDAIRARGEAASYAELAPPLVPPDENAVTLYVEACNLFNSLPDEVRKPLEPAHPDDPLTEAEVQVARASLDACSNIFTLIHQAGQRPSFRLSIDYAEVDPSKASLGELRELQAIRRLLGVSTRVDLAQGRFDHAADSISEMLLFARGVSRNPHLMALLTAKETDRIAISSIQEVLDNSDLPVPVLQSLLKLLPDPVDREPLLQGIRAERAQWIASFRNCSFELGMSFPWSWLKGHAAPLFTPAFDHEAVLYIRAVEPLLPLLEKPSVESLKPVQRLVDALRPGWSHWLLDSVPRVLQGYDTTLVWRGLARTAIALRLYRLAHGRYPDSLSALVPEFLPELPPDPFSGNPFVYRLEGKGFLLYSLGPNLSDEGGIMSSVDHDEGDIAWRCSR